MRQTATTILVVALAASVISPAGAQVCDEFFQSSSSPQGSWLGLHVDGLNYGAGQSFTLNCGSRLESVAFKIFWGTDYGDVRSLAYGDTVHVSILTPAGEELARQDYMIDTSLANRTVTFQFTPDDILLGPGTYVAACWTDVAACGGISGYDTDVVAGARFISTTASDLTSWSATTGEATHTIIVDSNVTPVAATTWDAVKASYR